MGDDDARRRYDFPPLWALPILVIVAIVLVMFFSLAWIGLLGLIPALWFVAWIERKADAYLRQRQASAD